MDSTVNPLSSKDGIIIHGPSRRRLENNNDNDTSMVMTRERLDLEEYLARDEVNAVAVSYDETHRRADIHQDRLLVGFYASLQPLRHHQPQALYGDGYQGYGNGWTGGGGHVKVVLPRDRKRVRRARNLRLSTKELKQVSDAPETLVPIRIDIELDHIKIRDAFTWNLNDSTVPLDLFAETLCEDYDYPLSNANMVAKQISEQLSDYHPHKLDDNMLLDQADMDLRVPIKLDITVGVHNLVDQFEWDMNDPNNDPEHFAKCMCGELSLSAEFETAIAHSIREQTQLFTKSLFLSGYSFDGMPILDEDIKREVCPPIGDNFLRPQSMVGEYTPMLYELSEAYLDRLDKDRDRESRRKRRQGRAGRRGAIVLPDLHDIQRTFRTPTISAVVPGALPKRSDRIRRVGYAEDNSDEDADLMMMMDNNNNNNNNHPSSSGYQTLSFQNSNLSNFSSSASHRGPSPATTSSSSTYVHQPPIVVHHHGRGRPRTNRNLSPKPSTRLIVKFRLDPVKLSRILANY